MDILRIFSPATVANVSCGFDAMAFALETLGDEMIFRKNKSGKVTISKIEGASLSLDPTQNAAGEVARLMLADRNSSMGVDIEIYKKYKPGSGLGSSAASSAGAAFAMNLLLGEPYVKTEVVSFAMKGEEVACGTQIADNVAAAIYGGFVLIRGYEPLDIVSIPTPGRLYATVIHPQIEVKTADARVVLPKEISLEIGIKQWANVGGLISGLHSGDYELIGRSLVDEVVEPVRKQFIPHFDALKKASMESGALGVGISGSGPSVFALSKGRYQAEKVAQAMKDIYKVTDLAYEVYVSKIGDNGVRIINK
jgi:homoserine kinase